MNIQELAEKIHAYCVTHYEDGYDYVVECQGVSGIVEELKENSWTTFAQWHRIARGVVDVRQDRMADAAHELDFTKLEELFSPAPALDFTKRRDPYRITEMKELTETLAAFRTDCPEAFVAGIDKQSVAYILDELQGNLDKIRDQVNEMKAVAGGR